MKNNSIGVFDSGIGGLTVLEKLHDAMPNERYIYLADHLNSPYGVKTEDEMKTIVVKNAKFLETLGAKCIVVACNTASLFLEEMQKSVKIPVISVIEHTCKKACKTSKNGKIGVIATQMTIKNEKYQSLIKDEKMLPFGVACSEFVEFLEQRQDDLEYGQRLVNEKIEVLKDTEIDTLIYGCTHFSLLEKMIKEVLGELNYIDCGTPTSEYVKKVLEGKQLLSSEGKGLIKIYTTGSVDKIKNNIKWFNKRYESIEHVDIR